MKNSDIEQIMSSTNPLVKVAELQILDNDYDLAKNGDHYHLVEHLQPDAYLRPVAEKVDLANWVFIASTTPNRVQSRIQCLLDILGARYLEIEYLKLELERVSVALQRESEPGSSTTRRAARPIKEKVPVSGILEEPIKSTGPIESTIGVIEEKEDTL